MAKERRLGRGIENLLNSVSQATEAADRIKVPQKQSFNEWDSPEKKNSNVSVSSNASTSAAAANEPQTDIIHYLDTDLIDFNPYQPREDFNSDDINKLAQSINEYGLLQPTVVRAKGDGRYELVSGERRLRAAIQVGWQQIPAMIIQVDENEKMAILALVENVQRKDLNAIEKAKSFKRLMKVSGCTQEELAQSLSLDRSTVANMVRLLDLPQDLQTAIREETISAAHGRALLPLKDAQLQREFVERIVSDHLSAHQVEDMVRDFLNSENEPETEPDVIPMKQESAQLKELENAFYSTMGMKVKLSQGTGGKGKMTISFKNHDQFERLQSILMSGDYSDVIGKKRKAA